MKEETPAIVVLAELMNKIDTEESRLHWSELLNTASEAYEDACKSTDMDKTMRVQGDFLLRLLYRVKSLDQVQGFNKVQQDSRWGHRKETKVFRILNYDYKTFLWAVTIDKNNVVRNYITNNYLEIPEDILTPAQIKHLKSKC